MQASTATAGTSLRRRVPTWVAVLGILSSFLVALVINASPAAATNIVTGSAGAGSGSGSGGYTWRVYGNGKGVSSGSSSAWGAVVNSNYYPCGTNCRDNFAKSSGYTHNWSGINTDCHHSAYIWMKVLSSGNPYIVNSGFSQSPKSVASALPTSVTDNGSKASQASGISTTYAQWRADAVTVLNGTSSSSVYIVVICSSSLPSPVQHCDDFGVTSSTYVIQKGTTPSSQVATSTANALAVCALHCPTATSSDPDNISGYLTYPGAALAAKYNTARAQGEICFTRGNTTATQTRTQNVSSGTPSTSAYYDGNWNTVLQGDNSGTGQTQLTHPGPTKFQYQDNDVDTPWEAFVTSTDRANTCPTASDISTAAAKNNTAAHAPLTITANNQDAQAEGGIMTIAESTTQTAVATSKTTVQPQKSTRTATTAYGFTLTNTGAEYGVAAYASGYPSTTYGAYSAWVNNGSATSSCAATIAAQTPKTTDFYQTYANHCNAADFNSNKAGMTVLNSGDSTYNYSGSLVSPHYTTASQITLGYASGDRAGQFDKICALPGTRDTAGSDDGTTSGVNDDGSLDDPSADGPATVTYFRDNVNHDFAVDHYVPTATGVVDYDPTDPAQASALATIVSTWSGGTPQAPGVSNTGQYQVFATDSTNTVPDVTLLNKATTAEQTMTDWMSLSGTPFFTNRTTGMTAGDYSTFSTAATWPSDAGKPVVFNVKWIYAPNIYNTVLKTATFTSADAPSYTTTADEVPVYGEVMGEQGASSSTTPPLYSLLSANTGSADTSSVSNPVNTLDGSLINGTSLSNGAWTTNPATYSPYNHVLKFVRGTTN